jgi:hypothetical protein
MTKKNYFAFAATVKAQLAYTQTLSECSEYKWGRDRGVIAVARDFAQLAGQNPNFHAVQFFKACGITF